MRTKWEACLRQVLAGLLALTMLIELLPVTPAKAAEISDRSPSITAPLKGTKVGSGKNVSNTYILEVSSGTRQGGGNADNVIYFAIEYHTGSTRRTVVLMPGEDAIESGFKIAAKAGNRNSRISMINDTFNCALATSLDQKLPLGSVQTDQFLFETPATVTSIDKIQVFGGWTDEGSIWACQGIRLYRVDILYGLEMYGYYSDTGYIDFTGEIIAEAAMLEGSGFFRWNAAGGVFNIAPMDSTVGTAGITLVNSTSKSAYESRYNKKTNVGFRQNSEAENQYVFRLDLADVGLAGFESQAALYQAGSKASLSHSNMIETASLNVRYYDVFDNVRDVSLPLMMNALGYIRESLGDVAIAGYGQQGDKIAFPAILPNFKELGTVSISLGMNQALTETGIMIYGTDVAGQRGSISQTDNIAYTCFALYSAEDGEMNVTLDGASIKYEFNKNATPVSYSVASSVEGIGLEAGQTSFLSMQVSTGGNLVLEPVDRREKYLITISTDNVANAGTLDDILIQFHYINMKDKEIVSDEYNIRDFVQSFYGEWPGNRSNFAYAYGFRQGGTVQFIIPLQNVKKFTDVSVKLNGSDEWQIKGLTIAMIKSYETRTAEWGNFTSVERRSTDSSEPLLHSYLKFSRQVKTQDPCFSVGALYAIGGVEPGGSGEGSEGDGSGGDGSGDGGSGGDDTDADRGTLIQDDGRWNKITANGEIVSDRDDIDWEQLSQYMTFEDAQQDLGFTRERYVYNVKVKVAGNKVNEGNDDSGSANLFYFQLIFERGTSGVTLANQQIKGDAFRTGAIVNFKIPTSQNYGDLIAIQVLPDNQDDNSNIYDKLQIEYIEVELKTDKAISPTWAARGEGAEGLGWVGIDYRDPGEVSTNEGAPGHSMSELATTYSITESSYSAKLLIAIETGPYGTKILYDENLNKVRTSSATLAGGMSMSFNYFNTEGRVKSEEGNDVIEKMNEYAGREGTMTRKVTYGDEVREENMDFYVSDPQYQFRAGTTDYFIITVQDITEIIDMKLQIKGSVPTVWNISNVTVYMINADGTRFINSNGEYSYRYKNGQNPTPIAHWNRGEQGISKDVELFRNLQQNSISEVSIVFEHNEISLDPATFDWKSKVTREPASSNDILNLYIYPATGGSYAKPSDYELMAAVHYTDSNNLREMQVSTGFMNLGVDENGNQVFYALGLNANNMQGLGVVDVKSDSLTPLITPMNYGIIQRIRGGVLIETYRLGGVGNADSGASMKIISNVESQYSQRLLFQLSDSIQAQELLAEQKDVAFALYFRTMAGQELRSKYVYLTDMGYDLISPSQVMEVDFDIGEISEITGINVVAVGSIDAPMTQAYLCSQKDDGTIVKEWSIQNGTTPRQTPARINFLGDVEVLSMIIETAPDEASMSSGTKDSIRMTVGYYDKQGAMQTKTYNDIRPYVKAGDGFSAEGKDELELIIPGLAETRYVELEPYHSGSTGSSADLSFWKPYKISVQTGLDGPWVTRTVDRRIFQNDPQRIFLADIVMVGTVNLISRTGTSTPQEVEIHNGQDEAYVVDSGTIVTVRTRITGSSEGLDYKLTMIDPNTGAEERAMLGATHMYDENYLEDIYALALASVNSSQSSSTEKKNAQKVLDIVGAMLDSDGSFTYDDNLLTFTLPRNYSDIRLKYIVKVISKENPDAFFTIEITVRSEEDQLEEALAAWNGVRAVGEVYDPASGSTQSVMNGGETTVLIGSGEKIVVTPRVSGQEGYSASIASYDPATKATGRARLEETHGYSESEIDSLIAQANQIMVDFSSTDEELQAAAAVLSAIEQVQKSGSFTTDGGIIFTAPANYTGSNLYYLITVNSGSTGGKLFTVVVTVESETNPLPQAEANMQKAIEAGNAYRASLQQNNNSQAEDSSGG